KQHFVNLLYFASDGAWPYEIVPAGGGTAMIKSADGYAFAGTGKVEAAAQTRLRRAEPLPGIEFDAAVFYVAERGFAMAAGKTLKAKGQTWFSASEPVNVQLEIGETAKGTIEARKETRVTLGGNGQALTLPAGKHPVSFKPVADKLDIGGQVVYAKFQEQHRAALAALDKDDAGGKPMQAAWKVENARTEKRTVYVNAQGQEVKNLTKSGTAKCWTEAQRGARPRDAVDGKPETYCAVGSGASWSGDLPKDIGMEWKAAVEVGCFEVDYHDKSYAPASDGHQLQAWDGADWQPVQAEVAKDASGANWSYTFKPLKTTRIRVFITKFNPMRTAVREMRILPEPATAAQRDVRIPLSTKALAAFDLDGDKRAEVLVATGNLVKCIKGDGTVLWQRELARAALCVDACDLDGDGKAEVVVGGEDHKLYCFDHKGNERWSALTPADPYVPEIEPATGPVRVVKCGDINGDGKGELVLGSGNWFAYAFDHTGKKLWGALNWAHQPTSIAFVPLGGGRLGALIGTTYCDADLFGPDGKKLQNVSVGYHGAAMSVAAGEVDGKMRLIAGSRIGGLHCVELGSDKSWAKFMGAEVTQVAMADLNGDGRKEIIAGSKNFYLLVTDADGNILWCRNV
ncbi:MAG: hypothetical protein FJ272_17785, partial [Planctomycetes bacterium]|nr:hypothetical protein [Planctomycetota bacterium]